MAKKRHAADLTGRNERALERRLNTRIDKLEKRLEQRFRAIEGALHDWFGDNTRPPRRRR